MTLADTSVWIEFLKNREPVFSRLRELMESGETLVFEPVFGELLQGAKSKIERDTIEGYWKNLPKADCSDLWLKAGRLSADRHFFSRGVGLIDAAIIIAAKDYGAHVWTLDKKLEAVA